MKISLKYFWHYFFPWATLFLIFFSSLYLLERIKISEIRQERELTNIRLGQLAIARELHSITSDLLILRKHNAFQDMPQNCSLSQMDKLQESFIVFSEMKGSYDQVRFLNNDGMECLRVNYSKGKAIVVPEDSLQNKAKRYYFEKSLNKAEGMVYVSPLDLNMEHGAIEKPHKSMIRFGTPVFNANGEKTGIILLNYLADRLLENFTHAVANIQDHVMIVNLDGYWLRHPHPMKEWGFMLEHNHNFSTSYPLFWEHVSAENEGQISNDDGLLTFTTVHLLQDGSHEYTSGYKGLNHLIKNTYQWKIISLLSPEQIRAENLGILFTLARIIGPLFLLLIAASWFLARSKIRNQKATSELTLAATVFDVASEGILVTDANLRIQTVNPSFENITGYSKEEVVGKTPTILHSGRHKYSFYREMWNSLSSQHQWEGEIWNKRKNGEIYPEWLSIVALVDSQNTINSFVALFSDITEKKKSEEVLKRQATFDDLTGLPNRALFLDRISRAILHSKRLGTKFGLLFIDLDDFKSVNDSLGHAAGDKVLQNVAQNIQHIVRESDTVARLGGDEFTVILNNVITHNDIAKMAELIVKSLSKQVSLKDTEVTIGASIGIAIYPENGLDQATLIKNADTAMYNAKQTGRNRYCFFEEKHTEKNS